MQTGINISDYVIIKHIYVTETRRYKDKLRYLAVQFY